MPKAPFVTKVYERTHRLAQRLQQDYNTKSTADCVNFDIKEGRKYYKIVEVKGGVHAFVDIKSGDVFKPAGYNKPARHVRYNLLDDVSYNNCIQRADWAGGYLYLR